jgi:hypothetical protein
VAVDPAAKKRAIAAVVSEGVEPVLVPAGFGRLGRRRTWVRWTPELSHVISLEGRDGSLVAQWGVCCDEAVGVLWGAEAEAPDVRWAVLSGTPAGIRHPSPGSWIVLSAVPSDDLLASVREAMGATEAYLGPFQTRRDIREYLLAERETKDRRGFVVPANLPLKLLVAATLAILDADPSAPNLTADAENSLSAFHDPLTAGRVSRLRALAAERA